MSARLIESMACIIEQRFRLYQRGKRLRRGVITKRSRLVVEKRKQQIGLRKANAAFRRIQTFQQLAHDCARVRLRLKRFARPAIRRSRCRVFHNGENLDLLQGSNCLPRCGNNTANLVDFVTEEIHAHGIR